MAPKLTLIAGGDPTGPATAAPVSVVETPASLKPNGEPATSSLTDTFVTPTPGTGMSSRPSPLAPMSA